ncbi:hypothetical protein [Kitasatospora purpeofusca]|uniref:hypothetical protein n=1 Tax=Kitasatospora purpeofusca TaxID=67352 RepID=UPI003830ADCB
MMETVVAVVGIISTLSGIAMSIATWRREGRAFAAAEAREAAREEREAAREELRLQAAARREAEEAQRRRVIADQAAWIAWRGRHNVTDATSALTIDVDYWGAQAEVEVRNGGRRSVDDLRIFYRGTDVTPGGDGLGLRGIGQAGGDDSPSQDWSVRATLPVASSNVAFGELHIEFTDADGRTWRSYDSGKLEEQHPSGRWLSVPQFPPSYGTSPSRAGRGEHSLPKLPEADREETRDAGRLVSVGLFVIGVGCLLLLLVL